MKKQLSAVCAVLACAVLAVTAASAQTGSKKAVTINFMTYVWQPTTVAATKQIVEAWNASHPSIHVNEIQIDPNTVHDYIVTNFAGGTAPDIIHDEAADIAGFTQQGYLADMRKLIPASLKASIPQRVWDSVTYGRKITAVPTLLQTYNVFANVDALKAAGVKLPTTASPWTWTEFRAAAKKLTGERQVRRRLGLEVADLGLDEHGAELGRARSSTSTRRPASGSSRSARARRQYLTTVHDMIWTDGSIDPAAVGSSGGGVLPGFFAGKYAMTIQGNYAAQQMIQSAPAGFHWALLPLLKGTSQDQLADPQTYSITSQSSHKPEAMQFLAYLANAQNMQKLAGGDWLIPSNPAAGKQLIKSTKHYGSWKVAISSLPSLRRASAQLPRQLPAVQEPGRDTGSAGLLPEQVEPRRSVDGALHGLDEGERALAASGRSDALPSPPSRRRRQRILRRGGCVQENELNDRAVAALAGAAVGDALGGATEGWEAREIADHFGAPVEGDRAVDPDDEGDREAVLAVPQGRRSHHRRHADDPRARQRLRREARPPRRLRRRVAAGAAADRGQGLDPRARARGSALPPSLPRREMARRAAAATGTATRARPASATSSTAVPRCTSPRSGSPTPATPTARIAEAADLAGAHQSSYGREAAAVLAAAVAEAYAPRARPSTASSRRRCGSPTTARAAAIDAVAAVASTLGRLARRRAGDAARGVRALRLGRRGLRVSHRSARGSRAVCTRSRSCRSRSACSWRPAATSRRRFSAASTTVATRIRSRRWAARSPVRSAAPPACAPTGSSRSGRRAATTSKSLAAGWRTSPSRSTRLDVERHARRGEALTSLTAEPSLDGVAQLS